MKNMKKYYKTVFGEILSPYSFSCYNNTFFRIVGDLIQSVSLETYAQGHGVTVCADLCPLSAKIIHPYIGGVSINAFADKPASMQFWDCMPGADEENRKLIDYMAELFTKHTMPYFLKATNSTEAWEFALDYNRNSSVPHESNGVLYYFALNNRNSEFPKKFINVEISRVESVLQQTKLDLQMNPDDAYANNTLVRFQKAYDKWAEWMRLVDGDKWDEIEIILRQNEQYSLEKLKRYIPKKYYKLYGLSNTQ